MIGTVAYIGICLVIAAVLTFIVAMFRSVQSRDEWKSWQTGVIIFLILLGSPYIWTEFETKKFGTGMRPAVLDALSEAGLDGKLEYYKVLSSKDNKARVVAVVTEVEEGVGTQRAVVEMSLSNAGQGWTADSYKVVNSDRLNRDGFTMPPFY